MLMLIERCSLVFKLQIFFINLLTVYIGFNYLGFSLYTHYLLCENVNRVSCIINILSIYFKFV